VSECYGRQYGGYPAIIFLLKTSITIINSVVDRDWDETYPGILYNLEIYTACPYSYFPHRGI
jgi:hypothetical protein